MPSYITYIKLNIIESLLANLSHSCKTLKFFGPKLKNPGDPASKMLL